MYPDGLMIVYDEMIYRISKKELLPLISFSAAVSWQQPILTVDDDEIENNYSISEKKLGFRPGTVLETKGGDTYYIEGVRKRKISEHAKRFIGFNDFESIAATDRELVFHPTGDEIG